MSEPTNTEALEPCLESIEKWAAMFEADAALYASNAMHHTGFVYEALMLASKERRQAAQAIRALKETNDG